MDQSQNSSSASLKCWLDDLQRGSPEAAEKLWSKFSGKLAALIRRRIDRYGLRRVDEEDLVVDVFASLCRGAEHGRFPRLEEKDDLWQVLLMLTNNKVVDQLRKSPMPQTESAIEGHGNESFDNALQMIEGNEPTPRFAAELADELKELMSRLSPQRLEAMGLRKLGGHRGDELSEMLQTLAAKKLESMTNREIAKDMDLSLRVVERGLRLIRMIWETDSESG